MGKTLLLADDSVTIQKVVGISFANEDISITTVDNGDDAITRARELKPDIVLADVVMPGRSGYDVCEAIKAEPELAHIPVLLLTGTFEAFDEEHASRVGAAGHVAKPFEAQTLVDRVKELLAAPAAAPAAPEPAPTPAPTPEPIAAPAAAQSPPPSAPATPNPDNSFDFFDDNLDDLSSSPVAAVRPPAPSPADDALDFGGPDAAFAFGEEDLAAATQEPMSAPPLPAGAPPDATVILPAGPDVSAQAEGPALDAELLNAPTEAALPLPPAGPPMPASPAPASPAPMPRLGAEPVAAAPPSPPALDPEPITAPELASVPASAEAPPVRSEDHFDFEFETVKPSSLAAGVGSEDLAQASVLDPPPAAAFDVSSSDLGPVPNVAPPPSATEASPVPTPPAAADPQSGLRGGTQLHDDPVMDLLSPEPPPALAASEVSPATPVVEPVAAAPAASAPQASPEFAAEPPDVLDAVTGPDLGATPPPGPEAARRDAPAVHAAASAPAPERLEPEAPMALTSFEPPPALESRPEADPLEIPAPAAPPAISEPLPADNAILVDLDAAVAQVAPALREQLHETLERIAWESFGQVTEKLVEQALERIEKIAWEVVPKLAETLIQEEIRKLKSRE